jgi:hypothetical protein
LHHPPTDPSTAIFWLQKQQRQVNFLDLIL